MDNPSREELLKKLGINLPTQEEIDSIINNAFSFDDLDPEESRKEIEKLTKDVVKSLDLLLTSQENVESYSIEANIIPKDKRYVCDYIVSVKPKKQFGLLPKKLPINAIRRGMYKLINKHESKQYYLYSSSQEVVGDEYGCTITHSCIYVRKKE